jgi:hypothetical protein
VLVLWLAAPGRAAPVPRHARAPRRSPVVAHDAHAIVEPR